MKALTISIAVCMAASGQDQKLLKWMDGIAQQHLARRSEKIAAIQTTGEAVARQNEVRAKILELLGGLPDYSGPLNPRVTGRVDRGKYVIENVIFESLPQLYITANLYRPSAGGRHPGILLPLGHWEEGKIAVQHLAANLAMKGFVVLAYDPLGQGERQQAWDRRTGRSLAGGSTTQHILAGGQSLLLGQSFARYRIWDAKRALDYLVSREEVDGERIGCTGCSGGGTLTTYISALDPRIKVAAPACYMQSFKILFPGPVGDSEQSLPEFLSAGLDQTDYVELFAPKPWLIASTERDYFTPKGAQVVFEEARRWYGIWGATEKVKWVVGPGGHGTPVEVREAIYEWMTRWLKEGKGEIKDEPVGYADDPQLRVTERNQVDGRDIFQVIRETPRSTGSREELLRMIRAVVGKVAEPGLRVVSHSAGAEFDTQTLALLAEDGLELQASLLLPKTSGLSPGVVMVEARKELSEAAQQTARAGNIVLALLPRGFPAPESRPFIGDWLANTRAMLIGRNLALLRAGDILRGVNLLAARADVDAAKIGVMAPEVSGFWALLAAAADERIAKVWLHRTPYSFRPALDSPLHSNLFDAVIPGFYSRWDISDLAEAVGRPVVWTDPTDWNRNVIKLDGSFLYTASDSNAPRFTVPRF